MKQKIKDILGSVRFWLITIGFIIALLRHYGVLDEEVVKIITGFLAAVVGVGTADSVAEKIGGKMN